MVGHFLGPEHLTSKPGNDLGDLGTWRPGCGDVGPGSQIQIKPFGLVESQGNLRSEWSSFLVRLHGSVLVRLLVRGEVPGRVVHIPVSEPTDNGSHCTLCNSDDIE